MNFTRPEKEKNTSRFSTNLLNMLPFRNARSIVATTESVDMDRKTEMLKILRELELVDILKKLKNNKTINKTINKI